MPKLEEKPPTIQIDGELVELRRTPNRPVKKYTSWRNSIRNSFRRRSSTRRAKSYDEPKPKEHLQAIKPKNKSSNSFKLFMRAIKRSMLNPPMVRMHPPAPLVIEDPPSSDYGSDLEDVKAQNDPALLNGSSGNFGSAGARSAPVTPQGIVTPGTSPEIPLSQPCSPGCASPAIHRSPSHSLFTKCDKASLKHLSTSTPAMTAQAQITEPPSPKTVAKEAKTPHASKAKQKKFNRHFPTVDDEEKVLNHYSCALIGDILLQGHLYITKNYFAFYSNVFGYVTKLLIPMLSVEKITKEKTARIIPNAVGIATSEDKHVFGSLMSRDNTYRYMVKVWELAQNASPLPEPEIAEPVPVLSDSDSSETRDGESGRDSPTSATTASSRLLSSTGPAQSPDKKTGTFELTDVLKQAISKFTNLPRQSLILYATTLLLILLFLSAAVLLYRISKIQSRYSLSLQDSLIASDGESLYSNLLQYQSHLHSKSAGAVHNFLDSNLDQIAKVRQSLEALSTLLLPNNKNPQEETRNS